MTEIIQSNKQEQKREEVFLLYQQDVEPRRYLSQIVHEAQGLQKLLSEQNDRGRFCGF